MNNEYTHTRRVRTHYTPHHKNNARHSDLRLPLTTHLEVRIDVGRRVVRRLGSTYQKHAPLVHQEHQTNPCAAHPGVARALPDAVPLAAIDPSAEQRTTYETHRCGLGRRRVAAGALNGIQRGVESGVRPWQIAENEAWSGGEPPRRAPR